MIMVRVWFLSALTLMDVVCRTEQNDCSLYGLLTHLNLEKEAEENAALAELRPVENFTQTSKVMVDMLLNSVLEINEKTQTFTGFVTVSMSWSNDFLRWNPADFCGNDHIYVPKEKIWVPDVIVLEDIANTGPSRYNQYAVLLSFGSVQLVDRYEVTTICKMDLYKFPFDTQICYFTFRSVLNKDNEIQLWTNFNNTEMNANTRSAFTSPEWDFLSINKTVEKFNITLDQVSVIWDQLKYMITLERKPMLYVINIVIPMTFMLILDLASFFISEAEGGKLGFKVTILLSIAVLLLLLQEILPSTTKELPLIALLCTVIFILAGLSLLEALAVGYMMDLDDCIDEDGKASSQTTTDAQQDTGLQQEPVGNPDSCIEKSEEENSGDRSPLGQILDEVKAFRHIWFSTNIKQGIRQTGYWKTLARRIDNIYFGLYLVTAILFLLVIFIKWIS